ncbi:DegT/DnrJ/EryC1/StrS family aminotransferase, partial [Bordetella hinzii]|nr:DegT/DnrJ/EryC1/StrS family aminotransferase [Bordetella hinzii]
HEEFGGNARMTAMQAAIGRLQLGKCAGWVAARRERAQALMDAAARYPALRVARAPAHIGHAYYRCYLFVRARGPRGGGAPPRPGPPGRRRLKTVNSWNARPAGSSVFCPRCCHFPSCPLPRVSPCAS